MERINFRKTIARSTSVLLARQTVIQLVSLGGSIILARQLTPVDFGIYAFVGFFMQFLTMISDAGLGAGLIQNREELEPSVYNALFVILQFIYLSASLLGFLVSGLLDALDRSFSPYAPFIWVSIAAFYLTSFRVIPAAKLERNLNFTKLSIVEAAENMIYQVAAVYLAFNGWGAWSFIVGGFVSRVAGTIGIYVMSPFWPGLRLDWQKARLLLRFGISLQAVGILSFLRDSLVPTLISSTLGLYTLGIVNFSNKISSYPSYPLNIINRMMFPLLSKVQDDEERFVRLLERIVRSYTLILYGFTAVLFSLVPEVINIIFSNKWISSVDVIYSLLVSGLTSSLILPIMAGLQARRLTRLYLTFNFVYFIGYWVLGIPLIITLKIYGLEILNVSTILLIPFMAFVNRKYLPLPYWQIIWRALVCLVATVVLTRTMLWIHPIYQVLGLLITSLMGSVVFFGLYALLDKSVYRSIQRVLVTNGIIRSQQNSV